MKRYMRADNLRPGSIQQYDITVGLLRKAYPTTHGPGQVTPGDGTEVQGRAA